MLQDHQIALNHMVAPRLSLDAFFGLAVRLGVGAVEIRNDLAGVPLADGTPAAAVKAAAAEHGRLAILSVNALQRFNEWTAGRAAEAAALIDDAAACGARALVLCPVNDRAFAPGEADRLGMLRQSLEQLAPRLRAAGLLGLVEPLGFAECSLRSKREAVAAIDAVGGADVFRLVHDTFHHHVAGETDLFPQRTGLVHVSGVVDPAVPAQAMRDPHRVLVDDRDLIDNRGQIRALVAGGYAGAFSFEPFAASVHDLEDPEDALAASIRFIRHDLRAGTA